MLEPAPAAGGPGQFSVTAAGGEGAELGEVAETV